MLLEFDITLVLNAAPFSGSLLQMFPIYCLLDMHAGITRPLLSTEFHCCDQGLYFCRTIYRLFIMSSNGWLEIVTLIRALFLDPTRLKPVGIHCMDFIIA